MIDGTQTTRVKDCVEETLCSASARDGGGSARGSATAVAINQGRN